VVWQPACDARHRESCLDQLRRPIDPEALAGIDPARAGRDMLAHLAETVRAPGTGEVNWTIAPCPTTGWSHLVWPELPAAATMTALADNLSYICRLKSDDPATA
jgi:aminopeptidase